MQVARVYRNANIFYVIIKVFQIERFLGYNHAHVEFYDTIVLSPPPHISHTQVLGTFFLLIGILAITDARNHEVKAGLKPLLIGIVLWAVGSSLGINGGYGINPARDFGPRVFTAIAGWGKDVFE